MRECAWEPGLKHVDKVRDFCQKENETMLKKEKESKRWYFWPN